MAGDGMLVLIRGDYLSFALSPGSLLHADVGGPEAVPKINPKT